ncbi:MAG TPA: MFS transporter [Methanobacterium sp.]|nr:MFS transporter [Methanobacterium sp.]
MVLDSNENNSLNKNNTKLVLIILLLGGFVSMLNETALNITFSTIMSQFHILAGTVQWLTTIYVLVSGIVFLISAFLIERFSTRKLFLSAMVFFSYRNNCIVFFNKFPRFICWTSDTGYRNRYSSAFNI